MKFAEPTSLQITGIDKRLPEGTIVKKAWELNFDKIKDGFLGSTIIVYADNVNKAKQLILTEITYDEWVLKHTEEVINYMNIPIVRCKGADRVIFEGTPTRRNDIEEIKQERKRIAELDAILNNPAITHCYIDKGGYYRPNWCGYTDQLHRAGIYTKQEAVEHAKKVREIRLKPIDNTEHNNMINKEIAELKTRLIKTK